MATRKIYFYEIRPTRRMDISWQLDAQAMVGDLRSLADDDRILPTVGGMEDSYEFAHVANSGSNPTIAFVRCRKEGLPMLAEGATLEALEIDERKQLAELTHAVFFDNHVIGAEYNHYGPRVSSLARYLSRVVPQHMPENNRVETAFLLDTDVLAKLRRATLVRSFDTKMSSQLLKNVEAVRTSPIFDALKGLSSGLTQRVGLSLQRNNGLDMEDIVGVVNWAFEQDRELLNSMTVSVQYDDGTIEDLNLLNMRISAERDMDLLGPAARSIDHTSARHEIIDARNEFQEQIARATALRSVSE